jgi:hypothetical protein
MARSIFIIFLLIPFLANAEDRGQFRVSSGTGFFVSNMGFIVTNKHVVEGCKNAVIKGNMPPETVEVVALDPSQDLALLRSSRAPLYAAPLRDNITDLKKEDAVLVMGYPGNSAMTGQYVLADAKVLALSGPLGEPDSIQFTDSVQQGNSGGPLLDTSGNVIGVIVAKSVVWQIDPVTNVKSNEQHSDVAISLNVLRNFLGQHGIYARDLISSLHLTRDRIEDQAKSYIVNVLCSPDDGNRSPVMENRILDELKKERFSQLQILPESNVDNPIIQTPPSANSMVVYDKRQTTR